MAFSEHDVAYMREALALAARARAVASPNPAVGCIIVADGDIVGRGATEAPGGRHAEIVALDQAGAKARGADVYVSLEPCAHFGRTPPCTNALIAAEVASVTFAAIDPNPINRGTGARALEAAGIDTREGLLRDEALRVIRGFASRMQRERPFLTCKLAMSLDGAVAMQSGESQWITGVDARRAGNALRAQNDAIITGIGTVLADDPRLTVRDEHGEEAAQQPLRVVVDSAGRLPQDARLLSVGGAVLQCCAGVSPLASDSVAGVALAGADGRVDLAAVLSELAQRDINEALLEAGPVLSGAFASAGLIDEFHVFVAPRFLGSATRRALATPDWQRLADGLELDVVSIEPIGADLAIRARPRQER
ncbi:MAG: bifunctional diaminohydroxyphosphoribosylaminopyrimidine deaminase/5-amino-6-(5-phosphoribosylamino)uracil reductase RibD [Pseudomonadota bacterium]